MTATTALIVHALLDSPERWRDAGEYITDGYHKIAFSGLIYSMGSAQYNADSADAESFRRALAEWKRITNWSPKEAVSAPPPPPPKQALTLNEYERKAYDEFSRSIRSSANSFQIHRDSAILNAKIQEALNLLDAALMPVSRPGGGKPNAKGS